MKINPYMRKIKSHTGHIFLIFTIIHFTFISCKREKNFGENVKYRTESDSTYYAYQDSQILHEDIDIMGRLNLPAISKWGDIVRLRGSSGWGTFDYICSIYNDENKRIQLIKQNNSRGEEVNYIYKERVISNEEYDTIMMLILDNGICEMPFDLEPDYTIMDGGKDTFSIKKKDFTKVVTWQAVEYIDSKDKEKAVKVFKEILYRANYPLPTANIDKGKGTRDSILFHIWLDDSALVMNFYTEYKGKAFPSKQGVSDLMLSKRDTASMKENLKIFITLGNGNKFEVKEIRNYNPKQ